MKEEILNEEILTYKDSDKRTFGNGFKCGVIYASQYAPQWIKVADRLPEDKQDVMVYFSEPRNSIILCLWNKVFLEDNATHWMIVPEPPEV